jgi:hypothetical protein
MRPREDGVSGQRDTARRRVPRGRVHAQDLRAPEAGQAVDDGPAHQPQPHHGHGGLMQPCTVQMRSPAGIARGTHHGIAGAHMACQADRQPDREFGRRLGQQVGHDAQPHAAPGAGVDVVGVMALEGTGHDAQLRRLGQQRVVDAIGHEAHHRRGRPQAAAQFFRRPGLQAAVHVDAGPRLQARQHLVMDAVGHHHMVLHGGSVLHLSLRRSIAPMPSTTTTQARMVSRMAATSSYLIRRSAAISSKPMPPAPTMPSTAEARKWYSQR